MPFDFRERAENARAIGERLRRRIYNAQPQARNARARRRPRLPATVRAAPGDGRRRPLLLRSASLHPSCSSVGAGLQSARAAPGDGWWGEPGLSLGKFSVANTHFGSQEGKWRII